MSTSRSTVAIAGASDLAKYFVELLQIAGDHNIILLSRAERAWFSDRPGVKLHVTDYSHDSILSILNRTSSSVLFSFLHSNDPGFYNVAHSAMLSACKASESCKRLVPSEYGGNIEDYPLQPRFYIPTHVAFRKQLEAQTEVEWTLVNLGWFADYFVQPEGGTKSYMKALPGVWPIDLTNWTVTVLGSGDEKIGWTAARDVASALVHLIGVPNWQPHIYVCGEIGTWNQAIAKLENFSGK